MESSEIFGGTEECNSCESGWTMYICSPIGSDDDDGHSDKEDHSNDHEYDEGDDINYNHEVYSDDSMASDASSGPNNQGVTHFRLGEDDTESRRKSEKKVGKPMDNQKAESRRKNDKEKKVVVAKRSTTASAQTGPKIRRYNWIGKRK